MTRALGHLHLPRLPGAGNGARLFRLLLLVSVLWVFALLAGNMTIQKATSYLETDPIRVTATGADLRLVRLAGDTAVFAIQPDFQRRAGNLKSLSFDVEVHGVQSEGLGEKGRLLDAALREVNQTILRHNEGRQNKLREIAAEAAAALLFPFVALVVGWVVARGRARAASQGGLPK